MKLKQERGQLTQRIKDKSKKLLGYKITIDKKIIEVIEKHLFTE